MLLKTVLIFNSICGAVFAISGLFVPQILLSLHGVEHHETLIFMARNFGVIAVAICLISFSLRNSEYNSVVKSVIFAHFLSVACGIIIAIWGIVSKETGYRSWIIVILYAILFLGFLIVMLRYKLVKQK